MSEPVRFLLNGERVDVAGLSPQTTLLEFLRDERRLTGTKEGCAEGDFRRERRRDTLHPATDSAQGSQALDRFFSPPERVIKR